MLQPHVSISESDEIIVLSCLNFDISIVKTVWSRSKRCNIFFSEIMILKKSTLSSKLHKNMPTGDFWYVHALPALVQPWGCLVEGQDCSLSSPAMLPQGKKIQG